MRPRPLGRGEPGHASDRRTNRRGTSMRPRPLGRGEPGSGALQMSLAAQLQCGHGLSAVENVRRGGPAGPGLGTSMRPRPLGRGERLVGRHPLAPLLELQCGHGLSAVENTAVAGQFAYNEELQCGHGLSAVENFPKSIIVGREWVHFNAATASRPWRTARVPNVRLYHACACVRERGRRKGAWRRPRPGPGSWNPGPGKRFRHASGAGRVNAI